MIRWSIALASSSVWFLPFGLYFFKENVFVNIFGSSIYYRIERVLNWKNGSGIQLENSIAAISASGILGFGFNSTPIYFPEAGTDFIFGVFASNFGFLGSSLLIIFFT